MRCVASDRRGLVLPRPIFWLTLGLRDWLTTSEPWRERRRKGDFPVPHHRRWPRMWQPAVELAGLPPGVTPYVLRHTAASLMAQQGVPVSTAAAALGHDPAIYLRTYAHPYPGDLRSAGDAMDAVRTVARKEKTEAPSDITQIRTPMSRADAGGGVLREVVALLADSGGDRDKLVESFRRSIRLEGLARPSIEESGDFVQFRLGVDRKVGALGKELPDETVPVLVGAPLPG